jgi:zinc protease
MVMLNIQLNAMSMQALGEVLTIKLIEQLRENESGVYGVSARGIMNKIQMDRYSFNIGFPHRDRTINFCVERIQNIIDNGEKDVAKFKEGEVAEKIVRKY